MKACHRIVNRVLPPVAFLLLFTTSAVVAAPRADDEDTYEITLIKSADPADADRGEREILEVGGRRVLVERHKVREGEWIWKIIREKAPPEQTSLHELVAVLKRLNPHLADLDRIHPGEVIMVPLRLAPAGVEAHREAPEERVTPGELEDIELERYTVRPGDSLVKILQSKYELSQDEPYQRYLRAIQRLNPSIQDPDLIHPGQVIRLPIHSPDLVRMPIEPADSRPSPEEEKVEVDFSPPPPDAVEIRPEPVEPDPLRDELGRIFVLLGADWIQRGQHYIPLKDRSGVDLRADNYPMIDLDNGTKVIVDLHHSMPGEMATLIETTWEHYRVVHLDEDQGLYGALDKILPECDLGVVYRRGEPYHLKGGLPVRITADWIIEKGGAGSGSEAQVVMITLLADETPATPPLVRSYLEKRGVQVLDYPPGRVEEAIPASPMPVLESGT
ncbi:MAG: LysM peptidoglycan-binding domain-containing protein, partial [Desulfobacteraceae bacterium]